MALLACGAGGLSAQDLPWDQYDGERVVNMVFEGVSQVSESELRASIATDDVRCKSILFTPFCLLTSSGTFEHKPRLDADELARDELRIRVTYWRLGYRSAQAVASVAPADGGVEVTFRIDEGEPTLVSEVLVDQTDSVLSSATIARAELPEVGEPVEVMELDSAGIRLRSLLWERGYASAEVLDTALVDTSTLSAVVLFRIEPGKVNTIDTVLVNGNEQVSDRTILRLLDLRSGQVFRRSELLEAQRRLYRSELFRQALTDVHENDDSTRVIEITVREAPFRSVRAGVGLNNIEFVQSEANFTRYNWHGTARRLDVRAAVGNLLAPQLYGQSVFGNAVPFGVGNEVDDVFLRPTWRLSAEVSQPYLFSRRNSIATSVFAHRRSVPGIVVDRGYGASMTITRRFEERIPGSITYRYERQSIEAGDLYFCVNFGVCRRATIEALSGTQSLSPLWLSVFADRADDPLAPTRGWTARLDAEHASVATASDFRYNRISAEHARYFRVGTGVLAARVRLGWVRGSRSTAEAVGVTSATGPILHPRKRFYAGGSQSVRGFGENQLGPRILTIDPALLIAADTTETGCTAETIASGECDPEVAESDDFQPRPLGGNSLVEASIEYRLPLTEAITIAGFVDGATVGDAGLNVPPGTRRAITPGFGVRYNSPIGPVRIDLGIRPTGSEELPVVTQTTNEEGELVLVQLDETKLYDPVGGGGGFLRGLFSHLQLHLSIGEAF